MEAFASQADFRCGRNYQLKFDPTVFWANAAVIARFPLHTIVARSYFSAMLHEAAFERKLSTKQRVQMDPDQVCAYAVCTAGEAVYEIRALFFLRYHFPQVSSSLLYLAVCLKTTKFNDLQFSPMFFILNRAN